MEQTPPQIVLLWRTKSEVCELLDNRNEAIHWESLGAGALTCSPSVVMMKSRLPKCMVTLETHVVLWLAIRYLMPTKMSKALLGVPIVGVLNKHQRVNLCMHILGLDSVHSGHKGYTGLG